MRRLTFLPIAVLCVLTSGLVAQSPPGSPFRGLIDNVTKTQSGFDASGSSEGNVHSMSGDGRYVVFSSGEWDLVADDYNGLDDVFLRDRMTGVTTRINLAEYGGDADGISGQAAISTNGRHVVYASGSNNLVSGDSNNHWDVFVRDLDANRTVRVSVATDGNQGDGDSYSPAVSADGRYVVFLSSSTTFAPGTQQYGPTQIYLHDRDADGNAVYDDSGGTTSLVSIGIDMAPADQMCVRPRVSADGRYVMFESGAANLHAVGNNGQHHLYVRDRQTEQTRLIDRAVTGGPSAWGINWQVSDMSDDGRFITYSSISPDIVFFDMNWQSQVFLYDAALEPGMSTSVISRTSDGTLANGSSYYTTVSGDGRFVAFMTAATNLAGPLAVDSFGLVVKDNVDASVTRVDVLEGGVPFDGQYVFNPSLSNDGTAIAFQSDARNAVCCGYPFGAHHIFVATAFSASPASASFVQDGGSGSIDVTTTAVSGWIAESENDWIVLMDGQGFGAGPRTVQYLVSPNPAGIVRNGRIRLGSTFFSVHQEGDGDTTPPVIIPTITGTLGPDGWYVSDIVVEWSFSDPDSEIVNIFGCVTATFTSDFLYANPTCEVTSHGGVASVSVPLKRDTTAPNIYMSTPRPTIYAMGGPLMPDFNCDDPHSGVASCTVIEGSSPLDLTPGRHTFTVAAADVVGNTSTKTVEYFVGTEQCVTPSLLPGHLKGWWKFDGNFRNSITGQDAFPYEVNGNFQSAVVQQGWFDWQPFNFLWAGNGSAVVAGPGLTVATWVLPQGTRGDWGTIVWNPLQYRVARFPDGTLRWAFNQTTGFDWVNTGVQLPLYVWSHVAVTYQDGLVQSYVNGTLVHSAQLTGTLTVGGGNPSEDLSIGGRNYTIAKFVGGLDDLMIFDDALPAGEVDSLALSGSGGLCTPLASNLALTVPPIFTHGSLLHVTALLTDASGRPLPNRPLTISSAISPPNYVHHVTTGQSGSVTVQFPVDSEIVGDYEDAIVATFDGDDAFAAASAQSDITVVGASPPMTWPQPVNIVYGTPLGPVQLSATSTLEGTFVYSPPSGTVLDVGPHTLSVTFTPTDPRYVARTQITTIYVMKATPTIEISGAPLFYTGQPRQAAVTVRGVGGVELNPYTVLYNGGAALPVNAGTYALQVTYGGSANYEAVSAAGSLVINKATPIMGAFGDITETYDGQAHGVSVNVAGVNGEWLTPVIVTYNGSTQTPVNAGVYAIEARYEGSANYNPVSRTATLTILKAAPYLTWPNPGGITYGTALGEAQLTATANVAGTFTYSPAAGTILNAGTHTLTASFTPADAVNYETASANRSIDVSKANPQITWDAPASIVHGTPLGAAQLNATANVAGTFAYSPASGTVLNAGSHTLSVTFTPDDAANYNAGSASVPVTVTKAPSLVTWSNPADIVYGTALGGAELNAAANVAGTFEYAPAAGTVLTAGSHTLTATFTPADTANYDGATGSVTINVAKAGTSITWPVPAAIGYGTALSTAQLNATANVAGTFAYSPAAGTALAAGSHTLTATFTPADAANYDGSTASRPLAVTPAPLSIRADDAIKVFGAPLPAFSATAVGLVNGDSLSSLGGSLAFSTTATASSAVGSYAITPSGVSSPNYAVAFANGTLAIVPASTAIAVVASPNPVGLNQAVTLTAAVSAVAPGAGTPGGVVQFFDGGTLLGSAALAGGTASLTTNGFTAGSHTITAAYAGNGSFTAGSGAGGLTVNTAAASSTTAVTSSANPSTVGQNVTLTATVTSPAGSSGSVAFYDGATLIGTAALSGSIAQLTTNALAAGGHAITARYLGNASIPPSTSPVFAQHVQPSAGNTRNSTTELVASPSPAALGSAVTLTATVNGSPNKIPTGVVLFMLNGSVLGQGTLSPVDNRSAAVPLPVASLPHGTHTVEAVYLGDATFRASRTSIALVVN